MRCLALADALAGAGWTCGFACSAETPDLVPGLARHDVLILDAGARAIEALQRRWPESWDLAVVDHYGIDVDFERSVRAHARRLLVIDDVPQRRHECDVIVDPTLDRSADSYRSLVPAGCKMLLGPAHAPLRSEFAVRRKESLQHRAGKPVLGRVLVCFGLTDPLDLTSRALDAMQKVSWDGDVDVLLGATAPHGDKVRGIVARLGPKAALHGDGADVAALVARADLVIGAPGMNSWERCCLGAPALLVSFADNQAANADALARHGAALFAGDAGEATAERIAGAFGAVAREPARLARMSRAAADICDGRGTWRVMMALLSVPAARSDLEVSLSLADVDDCRTVYAWQSDERIRRHSRNPRIPDWEEHSDWFVRAVRNPERFLCLIRCGEKPAGVLRLDAIGPETLEVSVLVAPELQGKGVGSAALALAHRIWPHSEMVAEVLAENAPSHELFARAGFVQRTAATYTRPPLARPSLGGYR